MADEDSNSGFDLISSQPERPTHETVPEDKIYRFKFLDNISEPKKVAYKLKKGSVLPYSRNLGGKFNLWIL